MSELLISLCNRARPASEGLLAYDLGSGDGRWIAIGDAETTIRGTRGTGVAHGRIYALFNIEWHDTLLAVLDRATHEILQTCVLTAVNDPHSLFVDGDRLLVASTGNDSVVAYDLCDGALEGPGEVVWRASRSDEDTQHVNAVVVHRGETFVSAFGDKADLWRDSRGGYIYNVSAGRMEQTGIWHPHSPCGVGDDLYFAESARQRVRSLGGASITVGAYARAIAALDERTILVGTNVARVASATTGAVYSNVAGGESFAPTGNCALASVTLGGEVPLRRYFDLSGYGREIYDVVLL